MPSSISAPPSNNDLYLSWLNTCRVLAVVSAQVSRPYPDRPLEGIFGIFVEMQVTASGEQDEVRKVQLTRLLERLFKSGRTVAVCLLYTSRCV